LGRVNVVLRHIERWILTLSVYTLRAQDQQRLMDQLDRQRRSELHGLVWAGHAEGEGPAPLTAPSVNAAAQGLQKGERLKRAFRVLARRYHPDLADNEADRARYGDRMAQINALYAQGNVPGLEAMAETLGAQGRGEGALQPDADLYQMAPSARRTTLTEQRLAHFDAVLESLHQELADLTASPTYALMDAMTPRGRRTEAAILNELITKTERERARGLRDIPRAMRALEACVDAYNETDPHAPPFDPYVDQELARLSLEHLSTLRPSPKVQKLLLELENIAEHQPTWRS
jgi:hypothetical protein